jgi:hypothetical protein
MLQILSKNKGFTHVLTGICTEKIFDPKFKRFISGKILTLARKNFDTTPTPPAHQHFWEKSDKKNCCKASSTFAGQF